MATHGGRHARVRGNSDSGAEAEEVEIELQLRGGDDRNRVGEGDEEGEITGTKGWGLESTDWERLARRNQRLLFWATAFIAGLLATLVALLSVAIHQGVRIGHESYVGDRDQPGGQERPPQLTRREVSKIAFGSCTSKGVQDDPGQPIWTQAVIPAEPDGWVWLGDMAYLDHPTVNCELLPEDPDCVCRNDYLRTEPWCAAGDPHHGLRKFQTMIRNPEYNEFLDFMCPDARELGMTPPPGTDAALCPRAIIGTWDDHDFGWNDGDGRLEQKWVFKNLYLDAIGEQWDSPRRNSHHGMWHKHVFNEGTDREIEMFLLDERYDRVPKPCYVRRQFCEEVLEVTDAGGNVTQQTAWCTDFLRGGHGGDGSCCAQDDRIAFGWCLQESNKGSPYWEEACDFSSREFGKRWLVFDEETGEVRLPDGTEEVDSQDSPFCEVLGREQRAWLQRELDRSTSALRFIVSGSVVLGNPGNASHACGDEPCQCSGDDWDCYRPAQRNLLSQLSKAPGCSVILTGDYHWGDIKALMPGADTPYAEWYSSKDNAFPIYQVMASGMTTSTAEKGRSCEGFYLDPMGLRTHPECELVQDPNFGLVEVSFLDGKPGFESLDMQIRDWNGTSRVSYILTPNECNPRRENTER